MRCTNRVRGRPRPPVANFANSSGSSSRAKARGRANGSEMGS